MAHELPEDFQQLLSSLAGFARRMLESTGSFYPFGAGLKDGGELEPNARLEDEPDGNPEGLVDQLLSRFREQALVGDLRALGICVHVRVTPPDGQAVDAVLVTLEDRTGRALDLFLPYHRGEEGVVFAEALVYDTEARVFTGPSPAVN